ncbi:protein NRT1/ PTR FAMILY 2.11 [Silene latifolia]|uniref:protein NRT1/ PTR FAMILY 2.11 n=1 Tax=Silene latifolia TaxID=37657 RepID=UPI003D76C09F
MENNEMVIGDEKPEVKYMGLKAMPFIIGNETFEKLGTIGTLANLLIYLTSVFNMKTITATIMISVFHGTSNFGSLLGAFLSDSYFGRYKTIGFATAASFLGLTIIALTATVHQLHPPHCEAKETSCVDPTAWQTGFLLCGFGLMVIGASGIRPCNLAFGADQFNPNTEKGKKGIDSFFNWYFFTFTFAQIVSLTLIVYIQTNVSWSIGLGIPAGLMLVSCVLFYMGSKMYVKVKPQGSPMTGVVQVIVVAVKKRKLKLTEQQLTSLYDYRPPGFTNSKLSHTNQFRLLDKAAIITPDDQIDTDGSADPWKLCSVQQVEEVKCLVRILPIWVSGIIYNIGIFQQYTYATFQALQSDRHLFEKSNFQIPAASYVIFIMLSFTLCLAIYDRFIVPFTRKLTGNDITVLQRIGTGMIISVLMLIVSAVVEERRRTIALTKPTQGFVPRKGSISQMSALWLIPQLIIAGLGDAFTSVGQMEFYYKQFPENMRSIAGAVFYCGLAMSSYLSSFLVSVVHKMTDKGKTENWLSEDLNKGRLDYFYYLVAAMGCLNFIYFVMVSNWYKYKGSHEGELDVERQSLCSAR